jgi:hypothetical protein
MGSYACERFGVERLKELVAADVHDRVEDFRRITAFETRVPAPATGR